MKNLNFDKEVKPSLNELKTQISKFAKSSQIESSTKILNEYLNEVEKFYPFLSGINFNDRKNNGTGSGGSIVIYIIIPFHLSEKYNIRFKLSMGGKHNGYSNGDAEWSIGLASKYKYTKDLQKALLTAGVIHIHEEHDKIYNFNYGNDTQGLKDLIITFRSNKIARKTSPIKGIVEKTKVLVSAGDQGLFVEINNPTSILPNEWDTNTYPVAYDITKISEIFTIPNNDIYSDGRFRVQKFENDPKRQELLQKLLKKFKK